MRRKDNIEVFQDTEKFCKENAVLRNAIRESIRSQVMIPEKEELAISDKKIYKKSAEIIVSKKRSFEAAAAYGYKNVCVHNFASATNPGGGVTRGSNAQEECLCRCSTLYFCLNIKQMWEKFYTPHRLSKNPIHNADIIYTPSVVVFKTDTTYPKSMHESDWYNVNVVTCAAPNLRERHGNTFHASAGNQGVNVSDKKILEIHESRLKRILDVAILNKNKVVILGAFGCGAFANKPEVVATAARNVMAEYRYAFETIEFAIYCTPWDETNYDTFKEKLQGI